MLLLHWSGLRACADHHGSAAVHRPVVHSAAALLTRSQPRLRAPMATITFADIARDPRWGRQAETYSEDPWLTGQLGAQIVDGTQRGDQRSPGGDPNEGNGYLQMIVAAKHATAYQIENNRFGRSVNVSLFDLADTFYPAWEAVVGDQGRACGERPVLDWPDLTRADKSPLYPSVTSSLRHVLSLLLRHRCRFHVRV